MRPLELRLRVLRERQGLTQAQLASRVGVTQATIAHWESGETRRLKLETIDQLCRALKTSPRELIRRAHARPPMYEARIRSELDGLEVLITDAEDDKALKNTM